MRGLGPIELIGRLRQSPIELKTLMAFGIAISGLLVFGAIAEDVMEGEKHGLDTWLLLALRNRSDPADPIGPTWLANAMSDITALGGFAVLTLLMTLSSLYLLLERKYRSAVFLVFSVASGTGLVSALKAGFDRPRPDLVEHLTHATSPSHLLCLLLLTLLIVTMAIHNKHPHLTHRQHTTRRHDLTSSRQIDFRMRSSPSGDQSRESG